MGGERQIGSRSRGGPSQAAAQIWPLGCGSFLLSTAGLPVVVRPSEEQRKLQHRRPQRRGVDHHHHERRPLSQHTSAHCNLLLMALLLILISDSLLVLSSSVTAAATTTSKNATRKGSQPLLTNGDSGSASTKLANWTIVNSAPSSTPSGASSSASSGASLKQRRSPLEPTPANSIFDSILGTPSAPPNAATEQEQDEQLQTKQAGHSQRNHAAHSTGHSPSSPSSSSSNQDHQRSREHRTNSGQQLMASHSPASLSSSSDKVTLPGDILLGGLFPIHMKGTKVECGQINRDRGIQRLEAMLYALDRINADSTLLPDIKLGAILLDSCSSSTYALNQSLEFIRASINTVESSAFECKDKSSPRPKYGSKMIAGVIGGSYSEVSLQVANLLRLFRIPQVSYASTGTALSDKTLYDLFARTVPSDMFQARAIADIVLKLGWSYVSLVSSEGLYGDSGSREFIKQASERRICIATHEKISPTVGEQAIDAIVESLLKRNATGVVLFTRAEDTRELLMSVKRAKLVHNFAWVAADGWGTHQKLVEGVEEVAWGAITVELQAKAIPGFDHYMKALTPWGNARNPWFSEYWQEWFDCQLQANLVQQQRLASGYSRRAASSGAGSQRWSAPPLGRMEPDRESSEGGGDDSRRARRALKPDAGCSRSLFSSSSDQGRNHTDQHTVPSTATEATATTAPTNERRHQQAAESRSKRSTTYESSGADEDTRVKQFCSPNLKISESNGYRQEQKVQFVVDAVYAMAHALHKAWLHLCGGRPGEVCEALKELNGGEFYTRYLLNVSFKDLAGSEVKFDEHGDGLGRYNIYNFRQVRPQNAPPNREIVAAAAASAFNDSIAELDLLGGGTPDAAPIDKLGGVAEASFQQERETLNGQTVVDHIYTSNVEFEYSTVGRWTEDDYNLALDEIQFFQGDHLVPESYCSKPCELGQAKIMRAGDHCCWICKTCQPYEFLPDEFNCQDCGIGRWPIPNKTSCYDLPQKVLRWDSVYSLISLSISCLGIALTLFVTIIFIKYIDTPVVKASGRELSFILLAGVAFCHMATFVLLAKPTTFMCGGQRFLVNFSFALMYASLLVKTNRISRIFNCARKSAKRPSFISPKSQMLITSILVAIQIFLTIVWFVFEPPGVRADSPEGKRDEVILKCRVKGKSFILSLVYNMILITTCTIYAVKTRKIPENFNESKFIGFTMYTTIVIWLAFVTMFFGTNNSYEIQMNTMCVCISLSAYVTLFCLFSPKISIILLHPDKNVRKLTMNSATYKRAFKPISSVASVEGRNNLPPSGSVAQQEPASGGPMSTTSNVLNLAESQAARLQESSVVSNVVNSNSAGSNCSQKTPTNLSQQLALVGICSNCGAHQLSALPTNSVIHATNATSTSVACSSSLMGKTISHCIQVTSNSPTSSSTKVASASAAAAATVAGGGGGVGVVQIVASANDQHQLDSSNCRDSMASCSVGSHSFAYSRPNKSTSDQGRVIGKTAPGAQCQVASDVVAGGKSAAAAAKVLHHKIGGQETVVAAHYHVQQPPAKMGRAPSEDNIAMETMGAHHAVQRHQRKSSLGVGLNDPGRRQQMASLSRLNEMTSCTSSDHHCNNESISSLANDSIINTSLENTPCNPNVHHHSHNHHHHHHRQQLSSSAAQVSSSATIDAASHHHQQAGHACNAHCMSDHCATSNNNHKGSDSMLCNQSVQSMDYCSDCCPSLCHHCSCPACSSNGGDESDVALCLHAQNSMNGLRRHSSVDGTTCEADTSNEPDEEDADGVADDGGDYDAIGILQLVRHDPSKDHQRAAQQGHSVETNQAETGQSTSTVVKRRKSSSNAANATTKLPLSSSSPTASAAAAAMIAASSALSSASFKALQGYNAAAGSGGHKAALASGESSSKPAHRAQAAMEMRTIIKYDKGGGGDGSRVSSYRKTSGYRKKPDAHHSRSRGNDGNEPDDNDFSGDDREAAVEAPVTSRVSNKRVVRESSSSGGRGLGEPAHVAYALQAAAASAFGATLSGQLIPCGDEEADAYAAVSGGPPARERGCPSQSSKRQQQQLAASTVGGGTIRASLELVRQSDEARRRSAESSRQRKKSGCFNYHDEYEYSYGLVESQSDSERDCYYYYDEDDDDDDDDDDEEMDKSSRIGIGDGAGRSTNEGDANSTRRRSEPPDEEEANEDGDVDDDFANDGRLTSSKRTSTSSNKTDKRRSSSISARQQSKRGQPSCHSSSSRSYQGRTPSTHQSVGGGSRQGKDLAFDEHRINSVALITATLSAGGAIVESSGSSELTGAEQQHYNRPGSVEVPSGGPQMGTQPAARVSQRMIQQQPPTSMPNATDQARTSSGGEKTTYLGTF